MPRKKVVKTGPKKEKFIPLEDEIISEEEVVPEEEIIPEEEESLQLLGQQIREARITNKSFTRKRFRTFTYSRQHSTVYRRRV